MNDAQTSRVKGAKAGGAIPAARGSHSATRVADSLIEASGIARSAACSVVAIIASHT